MNILDASALLAFVKKENGYQAVYDLFLRAKKEKFSASIHQVNFIEFIYKCRQILGVQKTEALLADLQFPFLAVVNYMDVDLGLYSSELKATYHLSLGDAIGLAYTKIMDGVFWSADRALLEISAKEKIGLQLIR